LERYDFISLDVDALGHDALSAEADVITETFGKEIKKSDGGIDRKKLGSIVFSDKNKLKQLENIVHPRMKAMAREFVERNANNSIAIHAAILCQMNLEKLCSAVIWVNAPVILRIKRAKKRDTLSFMEVIRRIWAQRKITPQKSCQNVDIYNVENGRSRESLEKQVKALLRDIKA